jgi:chromosome segregation protein
MYLKSIDLQGYKTFAGHTNFEFAGAITCIVGPNGSGKSNIADAIRWVLGEQSYRLLRGKKTEDMIFSGSEVRSRAGMASANIVFDNTTGWLPVDYSEVSIARRAYRDGTNEYLLNGQRVRLKDISELLSTSGLSERTYTIIGQGLVDAALALRAEERRRLFEEAAGIGLYRTRWEEAQRRLETTYRNLERVEDILAELKPRLRSLQRQARRAARYQQVEKDLRVLLLEFYGYHWFRVQRELNEAREAARIQESMFEAIQVEHTEIDQKLGDVREEIQKTRSQLGSWHRESSQLHNQREEISRELAVINERLRSFKAQKSISISERSRIEQQKDLQRERFNQSSERVDVLKGELSEARSHLEAASKELEERRADRSKAEARIAEMRILLGEQSSQENRLQERVSERKSNLKKQQKEFEAVVQALENAEENLNSTEARLESAERAYQKMLTLSQEAERSLMDHRKRLDGFGRSYQEVMDESSYLLTEESRVEAQLEVLEQAEKALTGYASGTQLVLKSAQEGQITAAESALSAQLDVPEMYETAIVAALGEYLDAVILTNLTAVEKALDLLVSAKTKGALLPLEDLKPPTPLDAKGLDGVLGVGSEIVNASPRLRPVVDLFLGQTLVVRNRESARQILRGMAFTTRAVTLEGEVFHASGPVTVGQQGKASTISRPRQRKELRREIRDLKLKQEKLDAKRVNLEAKIDEHKFQEAALVQALKDVERQANASLDAYNQIKLALERDSQQAVWQRKQRELLEEEIKAGTEEIKEISGQMESLSKKIQEVQSHLREQSTSLAEISLQDYQSQEGYWNTQVAVKEQALENGAARREEHHNLLSDLDQNLDVLEARIESFDNQVTDLEGVEAELRNQESGVIKKIEVLRNLIDPAETELDRIEKEHNDLQLKETKARQGLSLADRQHSHAQLTLTRKQELLDNLRERIEDDLGLVSLEYDREISGPTPLPFGEMVAQLPRKDELPNGLDEDIKRLRAQLRRMGSINPEAQAEYAEVHKRFEFMTSQTEDLNKAESDIRQVISELDSLMKREFQKTFEKVAKEFREIFTRLFGGGSARLLLTDPQDLAETGIEIEARLPGRRSQGLSLLSGGERSLTATALVFSLLKVSPTPFCVLDEVDAMLDETNVGRFRDLLRELADNTQFIVITHNRNTVQAADVIYGVTMGRDSVSQTISLKMDEVAELV